MKGITSMRRRTRYYKFYIYIILLIALPVIAYFYSRYVLFSGEPLTMKEAIVTLLFLGLLFIAELIILMDSNRNIYSYNIESDQITIKKVFKTYYFPYNDITHVTIKQMRLYSKNHLKEYSTKGFLLKIESKQYKTTIMFSRLSPEYEMLKDLKKNAPTSNRTIV